MGLNLLSSLMLLNTKIPSDLTGEKGGRRNLTKDNFRQDANKWPVKAPRSHPGGHSTPCSCSARWEVLVSNSLAGSLQAETSSYTGNSCL